VNPVVVDGLRAPGLAAARAAVGQDLHGCWPELLDEAAAYRAWWVLQWPAGAAYLPGLLAQDVQESVHGRADPV